MILRIVFICLVSLLILSAGFSQQSSEHVSSSDAELDSLYAALNKTANDTNRIWCWLRIGEKYETTNTDTALYFYNSALELSQEMASSSDLATTITGKKFTAKCCLWIGIVLENLGDFDKAIEFYLRGITIFNEVLELSDTNSVQALEAKRGIARIYGNIGNAYKSQGYFDKAISHYLKALKSFEEIGASENTSFAKGGKRGMSACYTNMGLLYASQSDYSKANEYYSEAVQIQLEIGDKIGMAASYSNMGLLFYYQYFFDKAIEHYRKALSIQEEIGNVRGIGNCYNNIALVYLNQGQYDMAIEYYLKSLKIKEDLGDKYGLTIAYANLASLQIALADSTALSENQKIAYLNKAIDYASKTYELASEIGALTMQNGGAAELQKAYTKLGDYKEAIKYAEIYIATKDSMFSEEKTKALAEMTSKYEAEKKQLQIEKMEQQKELDNKTIEAQLAENRKQQIIIVSAIGGFIIVLVFSVIILRMFRQKKKANSMLEQQNFEINQQKEEIEAQRDEITTQRDTVQSQKEQIEDLYQIAVARKELVEQQKEEIEDSIKYAKRIQTALLPAEQYANTILGEHFVLFRPKDVVSGDFYWATKTEDWTIVTAADCTGHGVPGAFMSMLGVSFLNEIVRKKDVTTPADVLNQLRNSVIEALKQTGEDHIPMVQGTIKTDYAKADGYVDSSVKTDYAKTDGYVDSSVKTDYAKASSVKDGMDMSIIAIHKDKKRAMWAGANNPVWIIRKDADSSAMDCTELIEEIKPDKMPVAVHIRMDNFTNHELTLDNGDQLYLFTDGYPDQFGGPKGKKFMYKPFKRLLVENSSKTMTEQKEALVTALDEWMSTDSYRYEQVDDITILGIKV